MFFLTLSATLPVFHPRHLFLDNFRSACKKYNSDSPFAKIFSTIGIPIMPSPKNPSFISNYVPSLMRSPFVRLPSYLLPSSYSFDIIPPVHRTLRMSPIFQFVLQVLGLSLKVPLSQLLQNHLKWYCPSTVTKAPVFLAAAIILSLHPKV